MTMRLAAGLSITFTLVMLAGCGEPMVSHAVVNHAYEGRMKSLVVYNHLYEGLKDSVTADFDRQFTAEMARRNVTVRIIAVNGVTLNTKQQLIKTVVEIRADTVLFGTWTERHTQGGSWTKTVCSH